MRTKLLKRALLFLWAAGLGTGTARAQLWQGPAALEVRAEDHQGKPAAGAQVLLVYLALDPPAGPAPVALDSRGRAVVGALAEGRWRLEVSREGFMTYQAEVEVRQERKPDVVASFQHNVAGALHSMRVSLARARSAAPPPPVQPAPPAQEPPPPAPAPAPAAPAHPPARSPAPAPPAAAAAPAPARPPARPAPPPAAAGVLRRSFDDRSCFECKPGEVALSVEEVVPGAEGDQGGCGGGLADLLARAAGEEEEGVETALPPSCRILRIALPPGARYTGYRFEVRSGGQGADCLPGRDCPGDPCRFPLDPVLGRTADGRAVAAAFENRSSRERRAVLTVYLTAE